MTVETKTKPYDIAAVMAISGLRFWENNMGTGFEIRAARILTQMIKANRRLMSEYLDRYCTDAREAEQQRLAQREQLDKNRMPNGRGGK